MQIVNPSSDPNAGGDGQTDRGNTICPFQYSSNGGGGEGIKSHLIILFDLITALTIKVHNQYVVVLI